ncbi:hypothetical protein [Nonomuraea rubra]
MALAAGLAGALALIPYAAPRQAPHRPGQGAGGSWGEQVEKYAPGG